MDISQLQQYWLPAALAGYVGWRFVRGRKTKKELPSLLDQGAVIVDVRAPSEFEAGSSEGSINIPLNELDSQVDRLDPAKPIVLCCASGTRSAMAVALLRRKGFTRVINAGSWRNTQGRL